MVRERRGKGDEDGKSPGVIKSGSGKVVRGLIRGVEVRESRC